VTLKFAPSSHRYWCDGKPIPGVTSLIKGGLPAPALVYWSARTVAEWVADNPDKCESLRLMGRGPMIAALKETPWQARDEAGRRGTEVHALAEQLAAGVEVEVPDELAGHVESAVRFLDEWRVALVLTETSVAHREHWWAGRLDMIGTLPDGRTVCFDWKTTRSGIFAETAFQLAAYSHAEFYVTDDDPDTEHPLPRIDECMAVWVRSDGYDVIPVDGGDETYKKFRHLAHVAKFAKTAKDDLIGVALPPPVELAQSTVGSL
jgi:hypothetical protein